MRGANGKSGVVFENSPEADAFARWQRGQFHEIERDIASNWRAMLSELNLQEIAQRIRSLGITPQTCRSVEEAYGRAAALVYSRNDLEQQIGLLFSCIHVPQHFRVKIVHRWRQAGFPPLAEYASYAAHVLKVEVFFQIALAANLISAERSSNRADIAYLFYLPFCRIFVSGDKLHRLCVPVFLRKEQDFIWAPDLKNDLARINRELMATTTELERQEGLHKLAPRPPGDSSNLIVSLWEKYVPSSGKELPMSPEAERNLAEFLKSFAKAPTDPDVAGIPSDELQSITIERRVPARKGS